MIDQNDKEYLKNTGYELFILLISLLSLFNLAFLLVPSVNPIIKSVLQIMDGLITVAFMVDFLYRLFTAESKREYFFRDWGWADLLAAIPVKQMKIFRIFRIIEVLRLLRKYGFRKMSREILNDRAGSVLYLTLFLVILVLEFGGVAMVFIEAPNPGANITTASDAVWWAFVTITTVGYGDQYPVTNGGRLIGMFVMALGVSLFGVLTGYLANAFIPSNEARPKVIAADSDVQEQIAEFRKLLTEQEETNALLKAKFEVLEKLFESV